MIVNRDRGDYAEMDEWLASEAIEVLMRVPERREIAEAYSRGEPLMSAGDEWQDELLGLYETIAEAVAAETAATSA